VLLLAFGVSALRAFLAMLPDSLRKSLEITKLKKVSAETMSKREFLGKQSLFHTAIQEKEPENDQNI